MKIKTLPIFLAFLVMGVADAMGPMSDAVKTQYELSNVMATLLSFFESTHAAAADLAEWDRDLLECADPEGPDWWRDRPHS